MDLVPDDGTEGFSFIWTIENFSYCLQKYGEFLSSPRFKVNMQDDSERSLRIYPRGDEEEDYIDVYLDVLSSGPFPIEVNEYISIRTTDGTFRRKNRDSLSIYEKEEAIGYKCFISHSELYKKGDGAFLENDSLTLRCRIWKEDHELPVTGQCYARTVIDVKRIAFVWPLQNFNELLSNQRKTIDFDLSASSENQSFSLEVFLSGDIYNEKKIQIQVKKNGMPFEKMFSTCKLSLKDSLGKIVHSVHDDHWFEASLETPCWHFTFMPVKKILDHKNLYMVNGVLSLYCDFAISNGVKYSETQKTEYGVADRHDVVICSNTVDTCFPGSWKDNLQSFYKEGKFRDLTIRTTSGKEFRVHKAILCARSEVFSAMFEHDTIENQTSLIQIEDLNDDIISRMLLFIYTDTVEDVEWQTASELYFAADKYAIVALKRECFTFLKGNLNCSNVCDVLVMADMHQDQDLKSTAQDFVIDHATEIINSECWKKFIQDKPNLAAETMHILFIRNLKILNHQHIPME